MGIIIYSGVFCTPILGLFNTVLLLYTTKYKHIISNAAKLQNTKENL